MAAPDLPISFDTVRRDPMVPPTAFRVAEYLQRFTRRCYDESFTATETIARFLDVSARTVQRALRCLASLGYLQVLRDRGLKTGHRIRMAWRSATIFPVMRWEAPAPPPAPNASTNDNIDGPAPSILSPTRGVPPDPPKEVSEDMTEMGDDGRAGSGDPASGHPDPETVVVAPTLNLSHQEDRTPEAPAPIPAEVIGQAEAVFGKGPGTVGRVAALARRFTPDWVAKALGIAEKKARQGPVGVGYLVRTLERFETEGGPPEVPDTAPKRTEEEEEAAFLKHFAALRSRSAGGPGS